MIVGEPLVPGPEAGRRVPRHRVTELTGELYTRLQKLFDEAEAMVQS